MRGGAAEAAVRFPRAAVVWLCLALVAGAEISVKVTGNDFLRDGRIKEVLSPEPETYDRDGILSWQEDAQFYSLDLYRRHGFFDARVDVDVRAREGGGPEDWDALLTISEGKRYVFDTVRVVVVEDTSGSEGGDPSPDGRARDASASEGGAETAGAETAGAETTGEETADLGVDTAGVDTVKLAPPQEAPQPALVIDPGDLRAKVGEPYLEDLIFRDRRLVMQRYGNSGYVRAKVDDKVTVKAESGTVKVDYLVQPSYPVVFDTLIIRNQRAAPADSLMGITRDGLLRNLVKYDKGDTVRISGNDKLIEKLQYTGAFNFVRLRDSLLPGPGNASALILHTEERIPGNFRTSTFYETYSGFGVSADARHNNFAGTLNEVRGGTSLASLRQSLYVGYGSPITLGFLIRFDNDFSINWYQDQPIHEASGGVDAEGLFGGDFRAINSARLTWPWSYWLRLVGNAELESKSRMLAKDSRERSLNLNFIQTALTSFLNQALDPTRGVRIAPTWGNGGPFIENGEIRLTQYRHNWLEIKTGFYYYYPPLKQVKLAARFDGGRFFGQGGTNSDRFFLGGGRSVRSYGFQGLCPETETDTLTNREVCSTKNQTLAYFLTSYEMRISPFAFTYVSPRGPLKHFIPLELVPFYDFGKVWDVQDGFAFSDGSGNGHQPKGQGVAWGLGFRYPILGIFNFRLDLAYGRPGDSRWPDAWVVDLAQAF